MIVLFFVILLIASFWGTIRFKADKTVTGIILILLITVFVAEYGDADYQGYLLEYQNMVTPDWTDTEPLWMLAQFVFRKFKVPFVIFRSIVFLLGLFLMNKTISNITIDRNVILVFFFLYPFMMDCTQIRNYLAMSILIFGLKFLKKPYKAETVKFCITVIICFLIHNVFVVYLIFSIIPWVEYRKFVATLSITGVLALIFISKLPQIATFIFGNYHNGLYAYKYVRGGVRQYANDDCASHVLRYKRIPFDEVC